MKIGTTMKRIRLELGLTQKEVAKKANIPYSTYSNYENNNREPSIDNLQKIALVLNSSIHELLYSANGLVNADDASFLLRLAGYYIKPCNDGMYLIEKIENNIVVQSKKVSNKTLSKFVLDVSEYIEFIVNKNVFN